MFVADPEIRYYSKIDTGSLTSGLFECRPIVLPDYADQLFTLGKSLLEISEWLPKLIF